MMHIKKHLISILIISIFPIILFAQNNWEVEQVTTTASRNISNWESDIAVAPNGDVHICYKERYKTKVKGITTSTYDIYYVKKINGVWFEPIPIGQTIDDEVEAAIAFGGGEAHIVFRRGSSGYYWNSSSDFGGPIEIPGTSFSTPDIAVESNGHVHIAFLMWADENWIPGTPQSEVFYTNNASGFFSTPISVESALPITDRRRQFPSIDVDENGKVGIAFGSYLGVDYDMYSIFYTSNASGSFFAPVDIISPGFDDGYWQNWPEVKVGDGGAYVFYPQRNPDYINSDQPGIYDLYYVKLDEVNGQRLFDDPVIFARRARDFKGSIAYNAGLVHLTYEDYKEIVKRKGKKQTSSWQSQLCYLILNASDGSVYTPAETVSEGGYDPVIDYSGDAHITFRSSDEIFYATNGTALNKHAINEPIKEVNNTPDEFKLFNNYPNPFNPSTIISFQLAEPSKVILKIYNNLGQEIRMLVNRSFEAGYFSITWDGSDNFGNLVLSGVYIYKIHAGKFSQMKKMMLLR